MRRTRIWTEIAFDHDGKQVGYLHLPHSVTRSAYGTIAIPLAVIRNGAGPTALFMAGNHGDEYEGQVALCNLIRELRPEALRGRVIVLPAANLPAALAGTRTSPLDGGNLNRLFPGDPDGGPTAQIAHYIATELFPRADLVHDFHSGGASLAYLPFASFHAVADDSLNARAKAALLTFGAPRSLIWRHGSDDRLGPVVAMRQGVVALGGEFGGAGSFDRSGLAMIEAGIERHLRALGILPGGVPSPPPTQLLAVPSRRHFVYAPDPGLFEPVVRLGDEVAKGDLCGRVHFVDDPLRPPSEVRFAAAGIVVCQRHPARVERGDCVAHTAVVEG